MDKELLEHLPYLENFCRKLTKHEQDAEDLVQDTIVKALENRASYDPSQNLRSWLSAIAENTFLDRLKKDREVPLSEVPEPSYTLDNREQDALRNVVESWILGLPESQQTLATLIYVEGLSYKEAADKLGISPGTVNQKLVRINTRLKKSHGLNKEQEKGSETQEKSISPRAATEQALCPEGYSTQDQESQD